MLGMTQPEVQKSRQSITDTKGNQVDLRVEQAFSFAGKILVSGWVRGQGELGLKSGDKQLDLALYQHRLRIDVNRGLQIDETEELGFIMITEGMSSDAVSICWADDNTDIALLDVTTYTTAQEVLAEVAPFDLKTLFDTCEPFSDAWKLLVSSIEGSANPPAYVRANVELAMATSGDPNGFINGWTIHDHHRDAIWVEVGQSIIDLSSIYRRPRNDVNQAFPETPENYKDRPGFICTVPHASPGQRVRIRIQRGKEIFDLAQGEMTDMPVEPRHAAELLFAGAPREPEAFIQFCEEAGSMLLQPTIEQKRLKNELMTPKVREYGKLPIEPKVSIIIPLYGRIDFVEHQLLEFSKDSWLIKNAEIIYVFDDPRLIESAWREFYTLQNLYGVPFKAIWGGNNRGFSGANNLGATIASGDHLLFLNSDVFPQQTTWLFELVKTFETTKNIGAIVPRLTFSDGSIQHAGMEFRYRPEYGVVLNEHPLMGLDPQLDDKPEKLRVVPAATGACILLSRENFDRVKGWNESYLIGDFEDSDLCLSLRELGLKIYYHSGVCLTHLERQSFSLLGDGIFKQQVTIYNAVQHQNRWFKDPETINAK